MEWEIGGMFPSYGLLRMAFKRFMLFVAAAIMASALGFAQAQAEPRKIVGFGDSLMAGYMLDAGKGFTDKLQAALKAKGHDVVIANAGVSGDTSSAGLARLDWSVPDGTEIVILELGANDMLRGVTPDITRRNLDDMISRLQQRKITVLLAGMRAAPNLGADYQAAFDTIYPDLAKKYDLVLYPFFLDGVAGNRQLQLEDGMHPNPAGVDKMVENFLPTMEKVLAAPKGSS
jgi:acyl-CoA thioesterase-1